MEALCAARPLAIGDVTLITIESSTIHSKMGDAGVWLSGFKHTYAVVVCDTSGFRAFDMD